MVASGWGSGYRGGVGTSIAVDTDDYPHISYFDSNLSEIRYLYKDATGWHSETVNLGGNWGYSSIALDSNDYPHVTYGFHGLIYSYLDHTGWHSETLETVSGIQDPSIALDSSNNPHISYGMNNLKYAFKDAGVWTIEDVAGAEGVFNSIAIDSNDYPHISYSHGYPDLTLYYAYKNLTGWHEATVDDPGGKWISLALGPSDQPLISYFDPASFSYKYATRPAASWQVDTLDTAGYVGPYPAPGVDTAGNLHISYFDKGTEDLKYAYVEDGQWYSETIDRAGIVGKYTSLALDTDNFPHISYLDSGNRKLKYAFLDLTGWHSETVDNDGSNGYFTSLSLDPLDTPHISYLGNGGLKLASWTPTGWEILTIDAATDVGKHTSLALDATGYPHISYFTGSTYSGVLRYAHEDASGWYSETVDTALAGSTGLALDPAGNPHISYYATNGDLKVAHWDGFWSIQIVDHLGEVGIHNDLAVDSDGYPHIIYLDQTNKNLKYAFEDDSGWHIQLIDSNVGEYPWNARPVAMTLDEHDQPHIVYYHGYNEDLGYAGFLELVPPESLTLAGPLTATLGSSTSFTATVQPLTATIPITYNWHITGGEPVTHTGGLTDTLMLTWEVSGIYTLTVTGSNSEGTVSNTQTINILRNIHLPMILDDFPTATDH